MESFLEGDHSFEKLLVEENYFGFRTAATRGRFMRVLTSSILKFENDNHRQIIKSILNHPDARSHIYLLVIWQLAINNLLFRKLMNELYFKFYFDGKVSLYRADVMAYLMHLKQTDEAFAKTKWSKETMEHVASGFLSILKKSGIITGSQKKTIEVVTLNDPYFTFFLYLLYAVDKESTNLYNSKFLNFCFLPVDRLFERIKSIARKNQIMMSHTGDRLKIEPIIDYKDLAHAVFNRPQSKV
jgi:hypothetical protein